MTTSKWKMMAALILVALLSACTSSSGKSPSDVVDSNSQETAQSACTGLGQEACEASDECSVVEGWPTPQACSVWRDEPPAIQPQFAACRNAGERTCPAAFGEVKK